MEQGQLIEVYFNLHKKVFSIRDTKTKRVIAHSPYVQLSECEFKVSEAGRQRVLREKTKNVHAYIKGKFESFEERNIEDLKSGYYDPYIVETFVDRSSKEKLEKANFVYCENKKVWYS